MQLVPNQVTLESRCTRAKKNDTMYSLDPYSSLCDSINFYMSRQSWQLNFTRFKLIELTSASRDSVRSQF